MKDHTYNANGDKSCPHCYSLIMNIEKLEYNKKYKCSKCQGKFFIIKVPIDFFMY